MKKRISILLAFVMLLSSVEVMAEKVIGAVSEVISEIEIIGNEETSEDTIELIPADYVYPFEVDLEDEGLNMRQTIGEQSGEITTFATTADTKTLWSLALIEQFSEEYLMPFKESGGEQVSGHTNRLIYRTTDLSLEGKNGLNVNITRKFDNQNYEEIYYLSTDDSIAPNQMAYFLYSFTESESNKEILIGFHTPDEYYMYMLGGAYVSELPEDKLTYQDYKFYDFDDIYNKITDDTDTIRLEPTGTGQIKYAVIRTADEKRHLESRKLRVKAHKIGGGWEYELPFVVSVRDTNEKYKEDDNNNWIINNSGVFCDLDGNIHSFTNQIYYVEYKDGRRVYDSDFDNDDDYIEYTSYYMLQTLEPFGIEYNMKAYDPFNAVTYYFYNSKGVVTSKSDCKIVAVVDEFGNAIRYEYNEDDNNLCKIIDTYGREIFLRNTGITYTDEQGQIQNISYELEKNLPSSELENDSILLGKDVFRLSVTNEIGETTVYESRQSEVTTSYVNRSARKFTEDRGRLYDITETSIGYDLERIVYPTGKQTHYRYKNFYSAIQGTCMLKSIHSLCERYDIEEGEVVNLVEYEIGEGVAHDIIARKENGSYTELSFDDEGKKTFEGTGGEEIGILNSASYSYDDKDRVKKVNSKSMGLSNTTYYTYYSRYKVESEKDNDKRIEYTYSGKGRIPETAKYSYDTDSGFVEDYTVETTKLAGTSKVEYEKVIKGGAIKAQTKYEYDSVGNVTAIYTWTEDTNSDGVLDMEDEYVLIKGNHTVTENNTHAYESYAENILNADGEDEGTVSVSVENNMFGSPVLQKDSYNNETTVEYDALNRPVRLVMPNGGERTIEYDNINNLVILTDENGIKIRYVYDDLGNILQKQKYHNNTYKTFEEYTYDEYQKPITAKVNVTESEGTVSYYTYDDAGRITKVEVKDFSDNLIRTENYSYAKTSNMYKTSKTVTGANGETLATTTQGVDKYGNVVLESQKSGDTESTFIYAYDYLNRRISETDANGNTTTYTYDTLGNVITATDAAGNVTGYSYDLGSRLVSQTDAMGNTSEFFYDGLSRKIKDVLPFDGDIKSVSKTYYDKNSNVVKQAVQNNAPGEAEHFKITEFKYDSMGNVIASIGRDSGGDSVVQYEYNTANKPTKMITGLSAYSENPTGGNVTSYEYQDGFLKKITDSLGQSESYTYDFLGNMLTKTDRNEAVYDYTYGIYGLEETLITGRDENYNDLKLENKTEYDNFGRVINQKQYVDDVLTDNVSFVYDAFGRAVSETKGNIIQEYEYDLNNNLITYILKENGVEQNKELYEYNNLNQLTNHIINGTMITYQYNPVGNISKHNLSSSGLEAVYQYNDGQMLLQKDYTGEERGHFVYTYSLDGNRITSQAYNENKEYAYDDLGRLIRENTVITKDAETSDILETEDLYTYDNCGNRLTKSSNGNITLYEYDANNRLISESGANGNVSYDYDNNGNTILKNIGIFTDEGTPSMSISNAEISITHFDYDLLNRLQTVTANDENINYTYGVDNLRKTKTVNGITTGYIWNGQNMVAETDGNIIKTMHRYSLSGIEQSLEIETFRYRDYIKNGHGDVTYITGSDGDTLYHYDAFGNTLWSYQTSDLETSMNEDNPFQYAGEYKDDETDFIYLRNRYYAPSNGRFITEDPIKDGLNWYAYCGGNPVAFVDPLGLEDVLLREIMEKNGATVVANKKSFLGFKYGLDSITVSKNGIEKTYTSTDYRIINDKAVINSDILRRDFNLNEGQATHHATDRFDRIEDVVLAFSLKYYNKSIEERQEYGAALNVDENGLYYFSRVTSSANRYGKKASDLSEMERLATNYVLGNAGNIHTHWNKNEAMNFSNKDHTNMIMEFAKGNNNLNYLVNPEGNVYVGITFTTKKAPMSVYMFSVR